MASVRILMVNLGRDADFYRQQIVGCDPMAAAYCFDDRLVRYGPERQRVVVNRLLLKCFDLALIASWWGDGRGWIEGVPPTLRSRAAILSFNGVVDLRSSLGPLGFRHFVSKVNFASEMGEVLRLCRGVPGEQHSQASAS